MRIEKSGRLLWPVMALGARVSIVSKCTVAVEARWPPAEKPMMPTFFESIFHCAALARTVRIGVEERHVRTSGGETVFEDYAGDAVCVEPGGDAVAFAFGHQATVASTGADDDRRAVRLLGQVYGDLRF